MAYLGRQPIAGNYQVLDALTATTTDTYALTKNSVAVFPQTPANCIVSLNGVIQAPFSSYTISGSNIVFASALTGSDSIDFITVLGDVLNVGTPSDNTVTTVKIVDGNVTTAKIADANVTSAKMFSGFANGITMADMWRVTGGFNTSGGDITTNWERADAVQYGTIGTGLTESSGIFSFPQTGIYYIHFITYLDGSTGNPNYAGVQLQLSTDNGSNWGVGTQMYTCSLNSTAHGNISLNYIADITNTSNDKLKFSTDVESTHTVAFGGNTTQQRTGFVIFRLGDT